MKYPQKYDGIVHNNLAEIMAEKEMTIHRLANKTGFSRALLSNLYNNPAQNTTIKTAYHIADSLEVPISRLFEKKTSFSQFNACDPNGFSKENLEILTTEIKKSGISPIYQVYNRDRNTNIYTAHAGNRRLSFRGNLRFIYWDIPELVIINLDISIRRIDVYDDETKSLHYNLLSALVRYAQSVGIMRVVYYLDCTGPDERRDSDTNRLFHYAFEDAEATRVKYANALDLGFKPIDGNPTDNVDEFTNSVLKMERVFSSIE